MKIVMSADCFYPAQTGGPSNAIYWQAKALMQAGHTVTVVATSQDLPPTVPCDRWLPMDCGRVIYTKNPHFYLPLKHIWAGWQAIRKADVVHVNSLFYPASVLWVLMGAWHRKPIVWSPHGELSPVALGFRPRLKKGLLVLFRRLSSSVWFHATCAAETTHVRQQFGPDVQVGEIRNTMKLPPVIAQDPPNRPYLLFIGRLHPIKAVDRLLDALGASDLFQKSDYSLLIAGPDSDKAYAEKLREQVQTLDLTAKVLFVGTVYGEAKEGLYAHALVTILPSHSENFGNVVIESLAQGTPVIASTGTPWQLLETERAGSWVSNEPDTLRQTVETYLTIPEDTYAAYRKQAADLARRDYDSTANVAVWERFYERVFVERSGTAFSRQANMQLPISLTAERSTTTFYEYRHKAIDFHEAIAAQFDHKYESSRAFQERFRVWTDLFSRYVNPSDQVMDLGCGSGIFSHYLAEMGCQVMGIDGSAAMIDLCNQKKTSANVQFIRQSLPLIDPVPYPPQAIVLMSSLLEYIDDPALMLQQVWSLLKPKGLFIVSIPNSLSVYRRIERVLFWLTGRPAYVAYLRNRSTEMLFKRQLTNIGFDVAETAYFSSHDPISRLLKPFLVPQHVNNLFVMVCRKK